MAPHLQKTRREGRRRSGGAEGCNIWAGALEVINA
jgi:hypothetical protein